MLAVQGLSLEGKAFRSCVDQCIGQHLSRLSINLLVAMLIECCSSVEQVSVECRSSIKQDLTGTL